MPIIYQLHFLQFLKTYIHSTNDFTKTDRKTHGAEQLTPGVQKNVSEWVFIPAVSSLKNPGFNMCIIDFQITIGRTITSAKVK